MLKKFSFIPVILFICLLCFSCMENKNKSPAVLFQEYCNCSIQAQYLLDDKTRVDIVTNEYAIEIDYAIDFYEAIGQSLFYAEKTGLKPGILLILKEEKDIRYLKRLLLVAEKYKITVWTLRTGIIRKEDK